MGLDIDALVDNLFDGTTPSPFVRSTLVRLFANHPCLQDGARGILVSAMHRQGLEQAVDAYRRCLSTVVENFLGTAFPYGNKGHAAAVARRILGGPTSNLYARTADIRSIRQDHSHYDDVLRFSLITNLLDLSDLVGCLTATYGTQQTRASP